MKSLNIFSKLCSPLVGSQSSDVGYDCRLTVGTPSGFGSKTLLRLVSVLALVFTFGVGNMWGAGAVTVSTAMKIFPAGSTTVANNAWAGAGAPSSYTSGDYTINSNGSFTFSNAGDFNSDNKLQLQASGGYVETTISSASGVDVIMGLKNGSKGSISVTLSGAASSQTYSSTSWGSLTISTTSTSATLKIQKTGDKAAGISYIAIIPKQAGGSGDYVLVENSGDIEAGKYLIVYNNTNALNTHSGNTDANTYGTYTDISSYYSSKKITANSTTNALAYDIVASPNGYCIKSSIEITFLGNTNAGAGAYLRWDSKFTSSQNEWTLGVNSIVHAQNTGYAIRWYNVSGSYRFAIYGTAAQQPVQLFKKVDAASCSVPTALTNGSINSSSQTVSWTAPASAPAGGYYVAFKRVDIGASAPSAPANDRYSTGDGFTVSHISAGTTTANIDCNTAGTYYWWVRSKCSSSDNTSCSGWVAGDEWTMKNIYLQVNDNWAGDEANFCAYYWDDKNSDGDTNDDGETAGFTKIMTPQTDCEGKIYTCVFPTYYSDMKFVRLDPVQINPVVNFDNEWNGTGNLSLAANKNYYQITGGTGNSVTGSWSTYAQKITVSFDKNTSANGVTDPADQCVVISSGKATEPTISNMSHDRLGYELEGWYTLADGGTKITFSSQTYAADQTLHAHWSTGATTPIALKATWSGSGNTWNKENAVIIARCYINGTNQAQEIVMTGNVCDDYFVANAPYGTTNVSFARCKSGTSSTGANWETDGNVYNYVAGASVGGTNTYEITGWGTGKVGDYTTAGSAYVAPTYTVSFANGGGTGTMTSHTGIACNTNQTLKQNTFEKDYYHFTAWHADVATKVGGATVDAGDDIEDKATLQNITGNIALTAQWAPDEYDITATLTNVSVSSAFPSKVTYTGSATTALDRMISANTGYNLPENITVTMGGVTQTKGTHYTYNNSTGAFAFTATITGNIVITVSGVAKTYSNTLDREGGTTGSTTVTTTYNSSTLTGYTAPGKTGYTFGGYWSGDDGTGTEVIGTNGALKASVTVSAVAWTNSSSQWVKDGAVTMYAKWTAKNYTVTLNDGSGSGGSGSKSVTYNANTNLTTNVAVPTYAGNDFRGYYTSTGGSGTKVIDGSGAWIRGTAYVDASGNWVYDGSPTLHAYYTAYEYENYRTQCGVVHDITLDDGLVATTNNGSAKVAEGSTTIYSIVAPTKNGYDIEGYYTTSGLNTKIATTAGALSASITVSSDAWTDGDSKWVYEGDATFYTKWNAHTYTLTYEGLEGASNSNPESYTIETATIELANPGSRTGYTFTGWTCGGDDITQITLGTTGDKTITANWSLNHHTVAVSAVDHVVITATPAGGSAIAESGSNTNVDYNKTITLGCTPDSHWNLEWDVYKTGETSTKVAVTGSGDGATFTMPDYNVTVTAVMTEDTYHTATFKNNGQIIDGYDAVKTYDGTKPSAPTLTDVTDACDKTDCNKFYGWIAEGAIWPKTINSVAGKTIYRNASDIPAVSGADVVYHAVWAKGTAAPEIPNTLIAKWDKQSLTASTAVKAKDKDGETLNSVTLTSNISMSTDGAYCKAADISTDPVISIAGLDFSDYSAGVITFFARGSQKALVTVDYSTDGGSSYSTDYFTDGTIKNELGYAVTVPNTTTNVKISYGSNTGNFYFGTVRAYGKTTTSYDFTELTSSNTSGWSGADWDGYYLIVGNSNTKALRSDIMEGLYGKTTVSPSEGVISTSDLGLMFKVKYNSSTSKYAIRSAATQDYLTDNAGGFSEGYHLLETSATEAVSIAYNDITNASGYYVRWNSVPDPPRFGSYSSCTSPTLYKIMSTFSEFRVTCCDNEITIGTPTKTGSGTVTFASGGDDYAVGDKVETCEGATTITATVTPSNGYQCTALAFSRADDGDIDIDPDITVPFTAATDFDLTVAQDANTTLNTTVTFVALHDYYIDKMHYNSTVDKSGNYGTAPSLSSETKGENVCTGLHYKFIGWIPEDDMNMTTGVPTTTANMVEGGATGKYATGTNYYAIWAEEE